MQTPTNQHSCNRVIHLPVTKPHLINYLRWEFQSPTGDIKISRSHHIGKYIFSRVRYSDYKQPIPKQPHAVLVLPDHELDYCDYSFICFTSDDVLRINDYIESMAYLDFRSMVQVGAGELKRDRKTIINLFSEKVFGEEKYEMLKKNDYRRRKKIEDWLLKSVKEFDY